MIATANDISGLPPEFLRKGRWDELWFVDLPNREERFEVLGSALRAYGRASSALSPEEFESVVDATETFTGSEIAAIVPDALFAAFARPSPRSPGFAGGHPVSRRSVVSVSRARRPRSRQPERHPHVRH